MKKNKSFLENLPFRYKISLLIVFTSIVVLLLSSSFMIISDFAFLSSALKERMYSLAKIIGDNTSAALLFNDKEEAEDILLTLKAEKDVVGAYIFDKHNRLFAFYERNNKRQKQHLPLYNLIKLTKRGSYRLYSINYIKQDIVYDKERIGTIVIGYNQEFLSRRTRWYIYTGLFILAISVVAAVGISSRLQRIVTGPIFTLIEKINEIREKKNYQIKVKKTSNDEIGQLIEHFNNMIDEIYRRDLELQKHKQHLEEEVKRRTMELESATKKAYELAKKAQAANVAKSAFLASMSHELRTPLNAIIGFTEILIDRHYGPLNAEQEEFLNDILTSAKHLLSLIDDILDITKIEAGRMELEPSRVKIKDLVLRCTGLLKEKTLKHSIRINVNWGNNVPEYVLLDERKIKQVMFNLLSNAAKFTPDESRIDVDIELVTYQWIKDHINESFKQELSYLKNTDCDYLKISVKDTGIGIEKENLQKIFEPFQQEDDSISKRYGGTGLGLSLSREIIRLHGGTIWVESIKGEGSIFTFVLPVKDNPEG